MGGLLTTRSLEITGCESIETTLRRRSLSVGGDVHPDKRRAPKRIVFGDLGGAGQRGRAKWEGEIVHRLHDGGLESDSVGGRGVGKDGHGGWAEVYGRGAKIRGGCG